MNFRGRNILVFLAWLAMSAMGRPAMASLNPAVFKVGSFTKNTATGSQVVTHSLGVTPKALILFTGFESGETATTEGIMGFGFYDGTDQYSIAYGISHNTDPISATRRAAATAIQIVNGAATLHAEASVTAWSTTTFTLNWTTNQASASVVHYMIIGGSHVSAKAAAWSTGTTAGSVSVTGLGFKPNTCIHMNSGTGLVSTESLPRSEDHASFGLGVMDLAGRQWAMLAFSDDKDTAGEVSVAHRVQVTDAAVVFGNGTTGVISKKLAASSMDSSGFTVTLSGTELTADSRVFSLCLQSVNAYAGNFTKSTSTSVPVSQAVTGPSFTPGFLLLGSWQHTTSSSMQTEARMGIGISDGSTEGCMTTSNEDNSTSADGWGIDKTSKIAVKMNNITGTTDAAADLSSFNSNGFTLSWTTNDAVATQQLYLALGTPSASAIELESFSATQSNGDMSFSWRTGFEHDSVGFHILEERGGIKRRLTREMIAGSAFLVGSGRRIGAGGTFAWQTRSQHAATAQYWLEEIDLSGVATEHGPIRAMGVAKIASHLASPLLSQVGQTAETPRAFADDTLAPLSPLPAGARPGLDGDRTDWTLPRAPAVKIAVDADGWHRVSGKELIAAGLAANVDPRRLRLVSSGRDVLAALSGQSDGRLDDNDVLEFYGVAADTATTSTRIYWLAAAEAAVERIPPPDPAPAAVGYGAGYLHTVVDRPRSVYFAALLNGATDNFFGPVVNPTGLERRLAVHHAVTDGEPATLRVVLQGASENEHDVEVLWNGAPLDRLRWSGRTAMAATLSIPTADGFDGENVVTLRSHDAKDVSLLDELALEYRHLPVADGDRQRVAVMAGKLAGVSGFASQNVRAFDVTDPWRVRELGIATDRSGGTTQVGFVAPGEGLRTVLVLAPDRALSPARVFANRISSLLTTEEIADLVVIGHGDLLGATRSLATLRESQGQRVALIDVEDLYDELSFGHRDPRAIRAYFEAARQRGRLPKAALLLGDASFDRRNYLGKGDQDLVPTALVDTWPLETASDDWFVDFDDDGLPDVAIGRIPARTAGEAEAIFGKLVRHEQTGVRDQSGVLLLADADEETLDFGDALRAASARIPDGYDFDVRLPGHAAPAISFLEAFSKGPLLVNYIGHGSVGVWNGGLDIAKIPSLGNLHRPSLVTAMTCFNGMFQDPQTPSLAEALLAAPEGGAMAVIASSGFTSLPPQRALNERFLQAVLEQHLPLGEALRVAKASTQDLNARRTFMLFGDPSRVLTTMTPRRPPPPGSTTDGGDGRDGGAAKEPGPAGTPRIDPGACACDMGGADSRGSLAWLVGAAVLAMSMRRRRVRLTERPDDRRCP